MPETFDYEEFWEELLADVEERRVVPVIGPALPAAFADDGVPLDEWLTRRLAEKLRIDTAALPASFTMNDVSAAFIARGGRREEIYPKLRLILKDVRAEPSHALAQLAEIGAFDLFVTLSFDSMLVDALNRQRFGGNSRALQLAYSLSRFDDLPREWDRESSPVVYHLLGKVSAAPEYAVTEEDMLEFVTSLQSGSRRPQLLFDELRSSHLLVIGARYPDWLARFLLRLTKDRQLSLARSERELLVDPDTACDDNLVQFVRHFSYGTRMVPLDPQQFVAELHRRWIASGRNAAAPPSATAERTAAPLPAATDSRDSMRPGSVFISYAREDLAHVLNLKEAFDRAGVEAWLDKDRLEAGDLYDHKIRRFIKTCAVFVPVISRNTERRLEAYFRREWKFAAERAQGIADQIPFVLPVVIDDTPEYGASVPECFLQAQWTRLVDGRSGGDFEARVAQIVNSFGKREAAGA